MSRRRKRAPSSTGTQLELLTTDEQRTMALLRERARLLQEIGRRKKELERSEAQVMETAALIRAAVGPLVERCYAVEQEIHALFAALLVPGRLSKRKRRKVRGIYVELEEVGLIGSSDSAPPDEDGEPGDHGVFAEARGDGLPGDHSERGGEDTSGPSASKPVGEGHRTLRTLFKRLVVALHPDRARQEDEKARRTATMKDVTRAYELGDLARLIELDELLSRGGAVTATGAADAARAVELLERTILELKAQLREGLDQLRDLRRSEPYLATKDFDRFNRAGGDAIAMLKEEEQARLDDLEATRDFVAAFDAGKVTFDEFVRGPAVASDSVDDADVDLEELLADQLVGTTSAPLRRRRKGKRGAEPPIPF